MAGSQIEFRVSGPGADQDARELADLLAAEFDDWPSRFARRAPDAPGEPTRGEEALMLVAVLLAVPPAVLATWNLVVRTKAVEAARRLIAWAKQRRARGREGRITWLAPDGRAAPLDEARAEEIADALAAMAEAARRDKGETA